MVGDDLLEDLGRRLLADLSRSSLMGALPVGPGPAKRSRMPKMAIAPSGEDFDQRLRGIRRLISVKEMAALQHVHPETIYRRIKAGMPAEHDGRSVKIYPPKVADWRLEMREARKHRMKSMSCAIGPKSDGARRERSARND